jgi:hypothetical protein
MLGICEGCAEQFCRRCAGSDWWCEDCQEAGKDEE